MTAIFRSVPIAILESILWSSPAMTRRKQPPAGTIAVTSGFRDPATWLAPYLADLEAECGMAKNTIEAYRRDLEKFFSWNRDHSR
ncbi:MAG: site-specific integrase, partial [Pirellulaceae bacterium]